MAGLLLTLGCYACGTDSVGVSECRQIEEARCSAAAKCGSVEDLQACKAFFHDHCLHGLAIEEAPRANTVKACVDTIAAAGTCAAKHGAKTPPLECNSEKLKSTEAQRVCDVVEEPELAKACSFLVPEPQEEDEDDDEDKDEDAGGKAAEASDGG